MTNSGSKRVTFTGEVNKTSTLRSEGHPSLSETCFRLPARLCRAGFVNPQGRDERVLCFEALPPFSSFPDAKKPSFCAASDTRLLLCRNDGRPCRGSPPTVLAANASMRGRDEKGGCLGSPQFGEFKQWRAIIAKPVYSSFVKQLGSAGHRARAIVRSYEASNGEDGSRIGVERGDMSGAGRSGRVPAIVPAAPAY